MLLLVFSLPVQAAVDPIYTGFFGNEAIKGYDAVAYFSQGEPVKGSDDFTYDYMGA